MRKRVSAILVGVNTVIRDNPMLNCRVKNPSNPARIICDSHLRMSLNSNIAKTAKEIPTYVATLSEDTEKKKAFSECGINIIKAENDNGQVDLKALMKTLGEMQIDSVIAEGGSKIHASILKNKIADKIQIYQAPKIIGGDGINAVGAMGITEMSRAIMLKNPYVTYFGDDLLIEYEVQ